MKKCFIFLLIFILTLTGCSTGNIQSASEQELKEYAQEHFGDAIYLRKEERDDSFICHFQDKQLGFRYYIESRNNSTSKNSNFYTEYYLAVINYAGGINVIEDAYIEVNDIYNKDNTILAYLIIKDGDDIDKVISSIEELSSMVRNADTRKILIDHKIMVKYSNDKCIGEYSIYDRKYTPINI